MTQKQSRKELLQDLFNTRKEKEECSYPILNKILVSEGGVQSIHEAFLFPIIVWTKEEYNQFLPNSLFPNLGATIHDLERLKVGVLETSIWWHVVVLWF